MLFKNEYESLKLEITNYELPAGEAYPDSDDQNWLILRATWINEDGELSKDSNACLLTYELQEMTAGLKVLNAGIKNSYEGEFTSSYFALAADAEDDGFRVYVSFIMPNKMDGNDTAELSCPMTKAEMKELIAELDRLCARFPDRTR